MLSFFLWCLFAAHGVLGNLLVFVGGGLFSTALLAATAVGATILQARWDPSLP